MKNVIIPGASGNIAGIADVIEASDLENTILWSTWFTNADEVDYETTAKGEPEKGSVISQKKFSNFNFYSLTL